MGVEEDSDLYPDADTVKTYDMCATIIPFNLNIKGFIDLTGDLPHNSRRGNLYAVVLYYYDSNTILAEPIKIGRQQSSVILSSRSTRL